MAGYDDPRYLQQVIDDLKKRLDYLERSTLPLAVHQRGPIPGWLYAGQIGPGAGTKSAMHLHLDGNQPGIAPRATVTDANGTVRVEYGNLAANGVSPAQFGFRANDANSNPIFDSLGLISVMTVLAQQTSGVITQSITGPVTAATVNSSSVTFSIPRTLKVMTFYSCIFGNAGGTAFSYANARMDGSDAGNNNHHFMVSGSGTSTYTMGFHVRIDSLGAGSHTADITADVDSGVNANYYKTGLYVFQLGS
jgi:hypothetical protein